MYTLPDVGCSCQTLKNSLHKVAVPSSPRVCLSLPHDPDTVVIILSPRQIEGSQPGFPFWLCQLFTVSLQTCSEDLKPVCVCVSVRVFVIMYHTCFISPDQCGGRHWIPYVLVTLSALLWWQHRLGKTFIYFYCLVLKGLWVASLVQLWTI